jgi:hypothetical protein
MQEFEENHQTGAWKSKNTAYWISYFRFVWYVNSTFVKMYPIDHVSEKWGKNDCILMDQIFY